MSCEGHGKDDGHSDAAMTKAQYRKIGNEMERKYIHFTHTPGHGLKTEQNAALGLTANEGSRYFAVSALLVCADYIPWR